MKINPSIFRSYDIRGVYPNEINEKVAYLIGRAFVKFLAKPKLNIVIGQDGRLSSPLLFKALSKGIIDQGGNIIDIGLSITPMLYFAVAYYKFDAGIEISASHNPSQYNGFKLVRKKAIPVSGKTGLMEIRDLAEKVEKLKLSTTKGKVTKKEVLEDYLKFNLKIANLSKIDPLKIVIDTANSVSGTVVSKMMSWFPGKVYYLFKKLDGNFPNHPPDPLVKKNLEDLQKEIKNKKADLGVALDGDGDRIIFVDEKGEPISADLISALIAALVLKNNSKEKILYDVRSSRIVEETIKKNKGIPIIYQVGHSLIKEKMRKENILFAGELSGHYYLKESYFFEAPFFILFKILEEISKKGKTISEMIKLYKKYYHSGEINFEVDNKEKIIKKLAKYYCQGKTSYIDGLRVDFKDWWFSVRPSNTEPVLRLVVEAKTRELMEKKKKELTTLVQHPTLNTRH